MFKYDLIDPRLVVKSVNVIPTQIPHYTGCFIRSPPPPLLVSNNNIFCPNVALSMLNIPTLTLKLIPMTCSEAPDHYSPRSLLSDPFFTFCTSERCIHCETYIYQKGYDPSKQENYLSLALSLCSSPLIPLPLTQITASYRSKRDVPSPPEISLISSMSFPLHLLLYYYSCLLQRPIQFTTERELIRFFFEHPG
jgi:hypothetical protein